MKITEKRLRQIISEALREEALNEITRYEEEMGKDVDFAAEVRKYVSKSQPTRYAFTMTSIPKVGLNPGTNFNTPAGVYAYPLNVAYYRKLIENKLPFQSEAPYCNIMKLNLNGKWLYTSGKGMDRSTQADLDAAIAAVEPHQANWAQKYGSHYNLGIDSKIFDITFAATQASKSPKSTVAWTTLLRKLGYIGVYDPGNKVIHPSEPNQLVCLDPSAYEWVATYETKAIRKQDRTEKSGPTVDRIKAGIESFKNLKMPDSDSPLTLRDFISKLKTFHNQGQNVSDFINQVIDKVTPCDNSGNYSVIQKLLMYSELLAPKDLQKIWESLTPEWKEDSNVLQNFAEMKSDIPVPLLIDIVNTMPRSDKPDMLASTLVDILKKNNLPSELLAKIASIVSKMTVPLTQMRLYSAIAKHPNVTSEIIETLPAEAKIGSSKASPEFISQMYEKHENDIRKEMKGDEYRESDMASTIAKNKNAPQEVLDKIWDMSSKAKDLNLKAETTRRALAANPNIGKDKMQQILDEFMPGGVPKKDFDNSKRKELFYGLLRNPALPDGIRINALKKLSSYVTQDFLRDKDATNVITSQFLDDFLNAVRDTNVIYDIITHPKFSLKSLRRMTNHPDRRLANAAQSELRRRSGRSLLNI